MSFAHTPTYRKNSGQRITPARKKSRFHKRSLVSVIADGDSNCGGIQYIGRRRGRFRPAVQSLILDDCEKILVADIQIHIAVDACNLAFAAVLPDGVGTAVVGLIYPVRKPNGVAALDIIGGMPYWLPSS